MQDQVVENQELASTMYTHHLRDMIRRVECSAIMITEEMQLSGAVSPALQKFASAFDSIPELNQLQIFRSLGTSPSEYTPLTCKQFTTRVRHIITCITMVLHSSPVCAGHFRDMRTQFQQILELIKQYTECT